MTLWSIRCQMCSKRCYYLLWFLTSWTPIINRRNFKDDKFKVSSWLYSLVDHALLCGPASAPISCSRLIQVCGIWRPSSGPIKSGVSLRSSWIVSHAGVQGNCLAGIQSNHQTCDGLQVTSVVSAGCHGNSQPSPRVTWRTDRSTPASRLY